MNFPLTRAQVVFFETAANLWASRRKANDFSQFFFSFELGGITKHLMTDPAGNSEKTLSFQTSWLNFEMLAVATDSKKAAHLTRLRSSHNHTALTYAWLFLLIIIVIIIIIIIILLLLLLILFLSVAFLKRCATQF